MKKQLSIILTIALFISGISLTSSISSAAVKNGVMTAKEASYHKSSLNTTVLFTDQGSASAGTVYSSSFQVETARQETYIFLETGVASSGKISLNPQGSSGTPYSFSFQTVEDSDGTNVYYIALPLYDITYDISISFDQATTFNLGIFQRGATISKDYMTVTKGFTGKLKISDATGKITWKSKNKKIAKVSSKGVVTGVKAGKTYVYATGTDSDGYSFYLVCYIVVKKNVLTGAKMSISDVSYGEAKTNIYKVSFNSKGNLVIKAQVANNSGHTYTSLKNVKITVKDANGKVVGKYKKSTLKKTVYSGKVTNMTFTIKKKKLKKKKADLAGGSASFSGSGYYVVYY